jgi:thiamine pyrophosphokinase
MSSHHIIREDQEPALLILELQAVSFDQVQELLEWSPTVLVAEKCLQKVLSWGIKIDVVIARDENIAALTKSLRDQVPLKLLSCRTSEEFLSTALYFLIAKKQQAVNILTDAPLESLEPFISLDLSVFNASKRWSFIRGGSYEKWFPAGRKLYLYPSNGQAEIVTQKDGVVVFHRDQGFWVGEE